MTLIQKTALEDMLACREARAARQRQLIEEYKEPVVSFSMNIAGDVKNTPAISMLQADGADAFKAMAREAGFSLRFEERSDAFTGPQSLLVFAGCDAKQLKSLGVALEERDPWGRLFDIDVIVSDGEKLSRPSPRLCILCGGPAADCARSRTHGLDAIKAATDALIAKYLGKRLGEAAAAALVREAGLTPKPGLVDAAGSGAHQDMDLALLCASAAAIRPYFEEMAAQSAAQGADIERLIDLGKRAEIAMFEATGGVNAHKGAIFAFSLYISSAADVLMRGGSMTQSVKMLAAQKASQYRPGEQTHGDAVRASYPNHRKDGALAEGCKGFPMALLAARTIRETGDAWLALCRVMAELTDSNVLYRAGAQGLAWLRGRAAALCEMSADARIEALRDLDAACIARNISPGGAADMLALGMFLADLPEELL